MINWKIRFKNPMFWVQVIVSIFTPILAYLGITAKDLTTWSMVWDAVQTAVLNPYVLMLVAVSVYNTILDPTTTGITDSGQALRYDKPNAEK